MAINIVLAQPPGPESTLIAVVALTDSLGNGQVLGITQSGVTWQRAVQGGTGMERVEIWFARNAEGADTSITINTVADENEVGFVQERIGLADIEPNAIDVVAVADGNSATVDTGETAETNNAQELFIGGISARGGTTLSAPTNLFTIDDQLVDATVLGAIASKVVEQVEQAQMEATSDAGAVDFGGAIVTFFGLLLGLDSVAPTVVPANGGYEVTLNGRFDVNREYEVFFGPAGDETDAPGYRPSGRGNLILPRSSTQLRVYTPELEAGTLIDIFARQSLSPSQNDSLYGALAVVDPDFKTLSYQMRSQFPPKYKVGPRNYNPQPRVNTVKQLLQYSEEFDNGIWGPDGATAVPGRPDPFGGTLAYSLREDAAAGKNHWIGQPLIAVEAGKTYTTSVYAKANLRDWLCLVAVPNGGGEVSIFSWFNVSNGALGVIQPGDETGMASRHAIREPVEDWFRCSLTFRVRSGTTAVSLFLAVADDDGSVIFDGLDQDSLDIAFAHFDVWSTERAYVKTEAEAIT